MSFPVSRFDFPNDGELVTEDKTVTPVWNQWFSRIQNSVAGLIQSGTTADRPVDGRWIGRPYFDTTEGKVYWWNGTEWVTFEIPTPRYGQLFINTARAITIGGGYTTIINWDTGLSTPLGVTQEFVAGTLTIADAAVYQVDIDIEITFTSSNAGRSIFIRLFNVTDNVQVQAPLELFIGRDQDGATFALAFLSEIKNTNKAFAIQLGGGDTLAAAQMKHAIFGVASGLVGGSSGSGSSSVTLTGDVTGTGTETVPTVIANDAVTYAMLQNVNTARLLGRASAGAGDAQEITLGTNLSFTGTTLDAASVGVLDGDKGDITVSGVGTVWTIDNDAVTYAKMQNVNTARLLGRSTAGAGDAEEIVLGTNLSFAGNTLNAVTSTGNASGVAVRQTVYSGPIAADGTSNFGGVVGSTTLTTSGTLLVSVANGFDINGAVNRTGSITNASWTGLSTNGTHYLYLDVSSGGVCTPGNSLLLPTYREAGADVVTADQFTFNVAEMVGKVGNGATASQVYRIFVGECVVIANVVATFLWYGLNGRFHHNSGATITPAITYTINHHLGGNSDYYKVEVGYRAFGNYYLSPPQGYQSTSASSTSWSGFARFRATGTSFLLDTAASVNALYTTGIIVLWSDTTALIVKINRGW
jgi:hypothetical protein